MSIARPSLAFSALLLCVWPDPVAAQETDLATALMTSTIKIEGQGSTGTGFLLGQPVEGEPSRPAWVLVTTAHVLAQVPGDMVTLHLRKKTGEGFERLPAPLRVREAGKPLWVQHPVADVAVMRIEIPTEAHVVLALTDLLATEETLAELDIRPGEELLVLGFPLGNEGAAERGAAADEVRADLDRRGPPS